jgi:Tat protein translocase TatB subunit
MFEFGVGYSELFVLAIIAVIVIGPKDLPVVLRKFGQVMQKVRGMAREFQGHVDVAMKEAGVADLKKDLKNVQADLKAGTTINTGSNGYSIASSKGNEFEKFFDEKSEGETTVAGVKV